MEKEQFLKSRDNRILKKKKKKIEVTDVDLVVKQSCFCHLTMNHHSAQPTTYCQLFSKALFIGVFD